MGGSGKAAEDRNLREWEFYNSRITGGGVHLPSSASSFGQ
jgi:hypothetical protein